MLVVARDFDVFDDDLDDEDDLEFDENMRRSQRRNTKDSSDTIRLLFHAGKPQVIILSLVANCVFQITVTICCCIYELIVLVWADKCNYFEIATAIENAR
jgi:hypothetical protein